MSKHDNLPVVPNRDHDRLRRVAPAIPVALLGVALYACLNLLSRWLRSPLFHGHGPYGWPKPSILETCYLAISSCIPIFLWAAVAFWLIRLVQPRYRGATVASSTFLLMVVVELDLSWYSLSREHISWRDVTMFISEPWREHFGIQQQDVARFMAKALLHGSAILVILYLAGRIAHRCGRIAEQMWSPQASVILILLFVASSTVSGLHLASNEKQWIKIAEMHPLRPVALDRLWIAFLAAPPDLRKANSDLSRVSAPEIRRRQAPSRASREYDVLMIAVEGFNPRLVDRRTMPYWQTLARGAIVGENHYSTGNATHYGILGLLFGSPVTFYRGEDDFRATGSPFIDAFNQRGYSTRALTDLTGHRHMGAYMGNFSQPSIHNTDNWSAISAILADLHEPEPAFVFVYYSGTHYPYLHLPKYSSFLPETPEGFDFSRWDLDRHHDSVINRYRNCLRELDDWLNTLLGQIDLRSTLVIVAGDHGEEFFEQGRLAHSSSLGYPQIRTPLLILAPEEPPTVISRTTSHVQIMPFVLEVLGWPPIEGNMPQPHPIGSPEHHAIVAFNNHTRPAIKWAIVGEATKAIVETASGRAEIVELLDPEDNPLDYLENSAIWIDSFRSVQILNTLLQQRL